MLAGAGGGRDLQPLEMHNKRLWQLREADALHRVNLPELAALVALGGEGGG